MEVPTAKEMMIPLDTYPHVPYWFTVRQAVAELESFQIETGGRGSLPRVILVFDEGYRLMGYVRRRDVMRGVLPTAGAAHRRALWPLAKVDPNLAELDFDHLAAEMREQADRPVSEIMQPIRATVREEDHLPTVMTLMVDHDLSLLPVVRDGQVLGVVRTVEVLRELARIIV